MSQLLAMTKTYLIDDYYECENKLFSGVHQNNNNLLINRCYHKIADFVTTNNQSINNNNNNNSDKRVRHYSQQQFANNNINQKLTISPDIDRMYCFVCHLIKCLFKSLIYLLNLI
jgi:hypothetical protein